MISRNSALIFVIACTVMLYMSFAFNALRIVPTETFKRFQADSQSLVVAKLHDSRADGFLLVNRPFFERSALGEIEPYDSQYTQRYNSQVGAQGAVISTLASLLGLDAAVTVKLFESVFALLTAVALGGLLYLIADRFGLLAAFGAFIPILFSIHILLFARNLYWASFFFLLPYIISAALSAKAQTSRSAFLLMCGLLFVAIFVKCLCGYEFITNLTLAASPALAFAGIVARSSLASQIRKQVIVFLTCLAAFALAFVMHVIFLSVSLGHFDEALSAITNRVHQNTVGISEPSSVPSHAKYFTPIAGPALLTLKYLSIDSINIGAYPPFGDRDYFAIRTTYLGLFVIASSIVAWCLIGPGRDKDISARSVHSAIVITLPWSMLCSLSWLVAARTHSVVHMHMAAIVLITPFLLHFCWCIGALLGLREHGVSAQFTSPNDDPSLRK